MERDAIILICSIMGVGTTLLGYLVKITASMSTLIVKVDNLADRDKVNTTLLLDVKKELEHQGTRVTRLEEQVKK